MIHSSGGNLLIVDNLFIILKLSFFRETFVISVFSITHEIVKGIEGRVCPGETKNLYVCKKLLLEVCCISYKILQSWAFCGMYKPLPRRHVLFNLFYLFNDVCTVSTL